MESKVASASKALMIVEESEKAIKGNDSSNLVVMLDHIEQLLTSTEQGAALHAKMAAYLDQVKPLLNNPDIKIPEKGKEILNKANDFVQKRPLTTLGIAAGAGLLLALLAGRKK